MCLFLPLLTIPVVSESDLLKAPGLEYVDVG